jgi:hypothetical protein
MLGMKAGVPCSEAMSLGAGLGGHPHNFRVLSLSAGTQISSYSFPYYVAFVRPQVGLILQKFSCGESWQFFSRFRVQKRRARA